MLIPKAQKHAAPSQLRSAENQKNGNESFDAINLVYRCPERPWERNRLRQLVALHLKSDLKRFRQITSGHA